MNNIAEVKLLATREGPYTIYVFQELDSRQYIMCTKLPNWHSVELSIGDIGYLEYSIIKAGDSYYDPTEDKYIKYLYSNVYFINFVKTNNLVQNNELIL